MKTVAERALVILAAALFTLVLLLAALRPDLALLRRWQHEAGFRMATGYVMVVALLATWGLPLLRHRCSMGQLRVLRLLHEACGALLLGALALHAPVERSHFLSWLVLAILASTAAALAMRLADPTRFAVPRRALLFVHVSLSFAVLAMAAAHVYFVYSYAT